MYTIEQNLKASDILKQIFGFSSFRNGQEEIVKNILDGKQTLAIMPTGAGKSLCYQIPAIVSEKKTVVISPLISLIENQVADLRENGVKVEKLHSNQTSQNRATSWDNFKNGECKILYISPERLMTESIINDLKQLEIGLFVIDEIHCVSKWGQSFRPDYAALSKIKTLFKNSNIVGFTATADKTTRLDILDKIFNQEAETFLKGFDRPNLSLSIVQKTNWKIQILDFICDRKYQPGIIYCISRNKTEEVATYLNENGYKASPYHAGLDGTSRDKIQNTFMTEPYHIIVATIAFGMGIDKPDVRYVVHHNVPKSIEGYYQETGRAGRDGGKGHCLMYYSYQDVEKLEKLLSKKKSSERNIGIMLLKEVSNFAESSISRRKYLLSYFGEKYDPLVYNDNDMDDNSRYPKDKINVKDQMIILIKNHFSDNKKVFLRDVVKKLPLSIEDRIDERFWKTILTYSIIEGVLEKDINDLGSVKISRLGKEYILNPTDFFVSRDNDFSKSNKKKQGLAKVSVVDIELMKKLIILRKDIAKKKSLPPYAILQEFSLEDMTYKYPTSLDEFKNINGVGEGKVVKFGHQFIKLIKEYIEENDIVKSDEVVLRTSGSKSSKKLSLIQNVDKKIPLDEISESRGIEFIVLLLELESIVFSGTKLDIDYYVDDILDEDQQEELHEYFLESESEDISIALQELDGEYDEEELRIYRIKFLNDVSN